MEEGMIKWQFNIYDSSYLLYARKSPINKENCRWSHSSSFEWVHKVQLGWDSLPDENFDIN